MKLILRGDDRMLAQAQKAKAKLQVELALGRFGEQVETVVLRFSKGEPGAGPTTRRCQIIMDIKPRRIRVEHTDPDLMIAMERAADKAARSIARALDEERLRHPATVRRPVLPVPLIRKRALPGLAARKPALPGPVGK